MEKCDSQSAKCRESPPSGASGSKLSGRALDKVYDTRQPTSDLAVCANPCSGDGRRKGPEKMSLSPESASVVPPSNRPGGVPVPRVKSVPCIRRESSGCFIPSVSATRLAQSMEEEERGAAEIKSIMQHGFGLETPPTTFLGVSPPRRSTGAANPLVQDWNWQSNAYVSSHSNLQALREIDARGVSFLHASGGAGDSQLLQESPAESRLGGASDSSAATSHCLPQPMQMVERCISKPCTRVKAEPITCQVGFNVA